MSIHQIRPTAKRHRFDEQAQDFTKSALLNLLDGYQRIKQISDDFCADDIEYVETALNTACLYIIYSHPRSARRKRTRQLMMLQAANSAGGMQ
jgi:hypothetical protein